jgi:1-acyl-sn-glycerol-3-phosphate acyltransferase
VVGQGAPRPPPAKAPPEEEIRELVSIQPGSLSTIDAFGRDPDFERRAERMLEVLYRRYFRVTVRHIENVPASGPVLLVANHSGSLPLDGAMLKLALALEHPAQRRLRPLTENFVFHFPFVGVALNRFGAVRACQENAEALLRDGEAVAVFPEGVKGLGKPFRKRYQLQRFGRGGFIRLALRTRTPIVPVAIVGAEETNPVIARLVRPGRTLGLPYLPVTPTFPFLGPLGLVPLPTKWTIEFGKPVLLNADEASDDLTIGRLTEDIRGDIQARLEKLLSQRRGWFS